MVNKTIMCATLAMMLAGCATMTPEERSAMNREKAMAASAVNLCYAVHFGNNIPPEYHKAVAERGIDCNSPQMVQLMDMAMREDASIRAQKAAAYQSWMNNMQRAQTPIVVPQPVIPQTQNVRIQTQCITSFGVTTCN